MVRKDRVIENLRASRPIRSGRRPKTKTEHRVCEDSECSTVLSRYNLRPTCHVHSPVKFPRIRGRVAS